MLDKLIPEDVSNKYHKSVQIFTQFVSVTVPSGLCPKKNLRPKVFVWEIFRVILMEVGNSVSKNRALTGRKTVKSLKGMRLTLTHGHRRLSKIDY